MGKVKYIYDAKDLTTLADDMLDRIDNAVMASALKIRDNAKSAFLSGSSLYKYGTSEYRNLADGIRVGHLNNSQVRIHTLGGRDNYNSYKTRFFVGGTIPRTQTKQNGRNIKPYTKGYIKANNALDMAMNGAESILNQYIQNVLDN